jgi:ribonuclease D
MPDALWIDREDELPALGEALACGGSIGVDTEFLRERTFFPKLCLLQLAAAGRIWCVDTLYGGALAPLVPVLTAAQTVKILHAARQDLEAVYLTTKRVIGPVFDTQIAAACIGMKPQVGYAELVKTLLEVELSKGQTRTDWSKRPLTREQLEYAADDVLYLGELADRLSDRLTALGRTQWAVEDCAAMQDPALYEPEPAKAWERLRGIGQLDPKPRARAKNLAVWREKLARERDLPRAWIIPDAALFAIAHVNPASRAALGSVDAMPPNFNAGFAESLLQALHEVPGPDAVDEEPARDARPSPEQKVLAERLGKIVDARARELNVSPELLAPRGELKALALGRRDTDALAGWRRMEIGERLLAALS